MDLRTHTVYRKNTMFKLSSGMFVVKIGGSLINYRKGILRELKSFSRKNHQKIVIVPGGGIFAEMVRRFDLDDDSAHWMAILGMNQYGYLLCSESGIKTVECFEDAKKIDIAIFLPYLSLKRADELPHSWAVTSDSIAAWIAEKMERELIIATDVEGIYNKDGRLMKRIGAKELLKIGKTCVDDFLPRFLLEKDMTCRVLDGRRSKNIIKVMRGENIGTEVLP
ncbi:MAG: Uridylate kinase [Candidatus Methanolliviera sp. GoM_oil]|nr:MAG: Uridylate kinase [Candidatus Methanolliviera sp. GoM_oil]